MKKISLLPKRIDQLLELSSTLSSQTMCGELAIPGCIIESNTLNYKISGIFLASSFLTRII